MSTRFRTRLAQARGLPAPERATRPELPEGLGVPTIRAMGQSLGDRDEAEVCDAVAAWLRADGWEVFFEVPLGEGRPDIVGVRIEETLAIEAKLEDVAAVVKQGMRAARFVARPYVALPPSAAAEATVAIARIAKGRPYVPRPGVLAVARSVTELVAPGPVSRSAVSANELRRLGLVSGAVRGGVSGGDAWDRDQRLWEAVASGLEVGRVARESGLPSETVRRILLRIGAAQSHLASGCQVDCQGGTAARLAHRRSGEIAGLTRIDGLRWQRIERGR
jgi:hypothetical protein